MALSDFVNGYKSVPFYSQYSLSSHSVGVPQKMLCCTKNYIESTKKNISYKSCVAHQNYVDHKKYVLATNYVTLKKETHVD